MHVLISLSGVNNWESDNQSCIVVRDFDTKFILAQLQSQTNALIIWLAQFLKSFVTNQTSINLNSINKATAVFNVLSIKQFFTVIQAPLSYCLVEGCLKIEQQKVYFPKDYPKLQLSTLVQRLEYTFFFQRESAFYKLWRHQRGLLSV